MNLIEHLPLSSARVPIAEFREHLQLGTGFSDDGAQDALLETCLRAAMLAIEARTGKILITRGFTLTLNSWRLEGGGQALPVAPMNWIIQFIIFAKDGGFDLIPPDQYVLQLDSQRPKLFATSGELPKIPDLGSAVIRFYAGYGEWGDVPANLRQAMLMLATSYYENRDALTSGNQQIPMGVMALIEPFRRLRLGGSS